MSNEIKYGFRIVHIENISYINKIGFVHFNSPEAKQDYVSIGDETVIEKRKSEIQGVKLDKYIPFYFGPRSPMLYVIQHGYNGVKQYNAEEIVYCVIKICDIINNKINCQYTDGHALDQLTSFYPSSELENINNNVNYNDVYAKYWISEDDRDLKRRKEAELLIEDNLPPDFICGYVVYNESVKKKLETYGIPQEKICVNPNYYF